jgi:hypothetical protein
LLRNSAKLPDKEMGISNGEEKSLGNFWAHISPENIKRTETIKTLHQFKILFIDGNLEKLVEKLMYRMKNLIGIELHLVCDRTCENESRNTFCTT